MMFRVILCIQFYRFDATYFFSTLLKTIASADVVNIANLKNQREERTVFTRFTFRNLNESLCSIRIG